MIKVANDLWRKTSVELVSQLRTAGIEVRNQQTFESDNFKVEALQEIRRSNIRISILLCA